MPLLNTQKRTACVRALVRTCNTHSGRYSKTRLCFFLWGPSWQLIQLRQQKHWLRRSQLWNCLVWFNVAHATCVKLTVWFLTGLPAEITSHRTLLFQNPGLSARRGRWMLYSGVVCTGISSESLLIKRGLSHMKAVMFEIVNCWVRCIHLTESDMLKVDCPFKLFERN